jgi:preprotein translocase subunit SecF
LPVASILFVGAGLLGAGTLKDLSLVLFVGMLSGTYSSIFIATPVLCDLKEREPQYKDLAVKVRRRLAGGRSVQLATGETDSTAATAPATAAAPVTATAVTVPGASAEPADGDTDEAPRQDTDDGVAVPAAASRTGDTPPRPVTRQQRVTGSTQRRPGARKKRR